MTRRIGILLFDDVEVLDFAGPYEVFSESRNDEGERYCTVTTLAPAAEVTCRGGLRVRADTTLDACPPLDVLVVPGGPGTREAGASLDAMLAFLTGRQPRTTITSVCTGSFILARAGLLDGRSATTHHSYLDLLRRSFPKVRVVSGKVVDEGSIITAGGITSGIDLALYLLEQWHGKSARAREAERLEGPWT